MWKQIGRVWNEYYEADNTASIQAKLITWNSIVESFHDGVRADLSYKCRRNIGHITTDQHLHFVRRVMDMAKLKELSEEKKVQLDTEISIIFNQVEDLKYMLHENNFSVYSTSKQEQLGRNNSQKSLAAVVYANGEELARPICGLFAHP